MRWSIIRLIWFREVRDFLRDRRTLFMIGALPLFLYPLLGLLGMEFALLALQNVSVVGIHGLDELPAPTAASAGLSPLPASAWLTLTPNPASIGIDRFAAATALHEAIQLHQDFPPLVVDGRFPDAYLEFPRFVNSLRVEPLANSDRAPLDSRELDVLLTVAPGFRSKLNAGERPQMEMLVRDGDERSRVAAKRLEDVLARWERTIKELQFRRRGLPIDFDDPINLKDARKDAPPTKRAADYLIELLTRIFPFMVVMWSLAGALYPSIDVCAGEKERGTLETLLLSPASREEIVYGKFLAIWTFSSISAQWNLICLGGTLWPLSSWLPEEVLRPTAFGWSLLLALATSALFSAVSLALGVYARSTKEGQYYLMPLFLVTLPLVFLTMAPGIELNFWTCLVPVTGVALLQQQLMAAVPSQPLGWYFPPVLASLALSCWLALRWAVKQFQREDVLFREAEQFDLSFGLRKLFGRR